MFPLHMEHCGKPFTINVPRSAFHPYISWKKTGKHFSIPPLGLSLDLVSTFVRSFFPPFTRHQLWAELTDVNSSWVWKLQELRVGVWSWHTWHIEVYLFQAFRLQGDARSLGITLSVELFQCFQSTHPHNQNRTSPMRHSWRCVQGCTLLLIANQPSPLQNWRFDTLDDSNHPKT